MLKTELTEVVKDTTGLTSRQANEVIASFIEQVTNALARGERVSLAGFGNFSIKHVNARQGRNPRTGEAMMIAARNTPVFKPAGLMKEAVAGGKHD